MITVTILLIMAVMSTINPISLATTLVVASILITPYLHKNLMSSWLPLILILTFSSGMMTLFMYTSSLASNETNKNQSKKSILFLMLLATPTYQQKKTQSTMKFFSGYYTLLVLASILVITLLSLTMQSYNPHQTLSSSF